jgi:gamma-glutamyltranspeptidase
MATVHEVDTRLVGCRPAVSGRHWAVSSGHSLASLAAQRILDRGGNAIDAGVAAGICTNVVQSDMTSFAGVAGLGLARRGRRRRSSRSPERRTLSRR